MRVSEQRSLAGSEQGHPHCSSVLGILGESLADLDGVSWVGAGGEGRR